MLHLVHRTKGSFSCRKSLLILNETNTADHIEEHSKTN